MNKGDVPVKKIIVIIAIIALIILSAIYLVNVDEADDEYHGGSYYEGVRINMILSDTYILFNDLNLTEPHLNNLTNETFSLIIETESSSGNQSICYPFTGVKTAYSSGIHPVGSYSPGISYLTHETNVIYNFTIRWDINSTDPYIQNLSLLGSDNLIKGSFFVDSSFATNASVENQYIDLCTVVNDNNSGIIINLPLNVRIKIRPMIVCVD